MAVVLFVLVLLFEYSDQIKNSFTKFHRTKTDKLVEARNLTKIFYKPRKYIPNYLATFCCCPCYPESCLRIFKKRIEANKNISISIKESDSCAIVGLNGAGKTTLFDMLTYKTSPNKGEIKIDGMPIQEYLICSKILLGL